jgi:hypothetical protein
MRQELHNLIESSKGKFFSLTFIKANGQRRKVNGKNFYSHLLSGGESTVEGHGYVSMIDRNGNAGEGQWVCAKDENSVEFKCGSIQKTFTV